MELISIILSIIASILAIISTLISFRVKKDMDNIKNTQSVGNNSNNNTQRINNIRRD